MQPLALRLLSKKLKAAAAQGPNGWTGGYNVGFGTVAYLSDIPEKGGCFSYWAGSHRSAHQFFLENPGTIDGSWAADGQRVFKEFWTKEPHASRGGVPEKSKGKAVQVVGKAGDLLVWHGWLRHASSQNAHTFPRMALLGSFRNVAMENSGPPVFFESKSRARDPTVDAPISDVIVEHPSLGKISGYRSPPDFSEFVSCCPLPFLSCCPLPDFLAS